MLELWTSINLFRRMNYCEKISLIFDGCKEHDLLWMRYSYLPIRIRKESLGTLTQVTFIHTLLEVHECERKIKWLLFSWGLKMLNSKSITLCLNLTKIICCSLTQLCSEYVPPTLKWKDISQKKQVIRIVLAYTI